MLITNNYYKLFTTKNPITGVPQNADTTPSAVAYKNGIADDMSLTVALVSTGVYKITSSTSFTTNEFSVNDAVDILVSATVASIADTSVIDKFIVDNNYTSIEAILEDTALIVEDVNGILKNTALDRV